MTNTQELDPKLENNSHYWLYRATREQIEEARRKLLPNEYYWNRWAIEEVVNYIYGTNNICTKIKQLMYQYIPPETYGEDGGEIKDFIDNISYKKPLLIEDKKYLLNNLNILSAKEKALLLIKMNSLKAKAFNNSNIFSQLPHSYLSSLDFSNIRWKENIVFSDFIFPNYMNFINATFEEQKNINIEIKQKRDISTLFSNAIFIQDVNFSKTTFEKEIDFEETNFLKGVSFRGASFKRNVSFQRAVFQGNTDFNKVNFLGKAIFSNINLYQDIKLTFQECTFHTDMNFDGLKFPLLTNFILCQFGERNSQAIINTSFKKAVHHEAIFDFAYFSGTADFSKCLFKKKSSFVSVYFQGISIFTDANFKGKAIFYNNKEHEKYIINQQGNQDNYYTIFSNKAYFDSVIFNKNIDFRYVRFMGDTQFSQTIFKGRSDFSKSQFGTLKEPISIDFWRAEFEDNVYHDGVKFYGNNIYFKNAKYMGNVIGFVETEFHFLPIDNKEKQKFSFENTVFMTKANFSVAKFYDLPCLKATDFRAGLNLDKTKFLPEISAFHFEFYQAFFKLIEELNKKLDLQSLENSELKDKIKKINVFFEADAGKSTRIFIEKNPSIVVHDRDDTYLVVSKLEEKYGYTQDDFKRFLLGLEECLTKLDISINHQLSTKKNYVNLKAEVTDEIIQGKLQTYEDASISWHTLSTEMEKAAYHDQALKYFGYELEAKRLSAKKEKKDFWQRMLLGGYKLFSDYGQSITRPLMSWLCLIPLFFSLHLFFLQQEIKGKEFILPIFIYLICAWIISFFTKHILPILAGTLIGVCLFHFDYSLQALQLSFKGAIPFVSDQTTFYDRMFGDADEKKSYKIISQDKNKPLNLVMAEQEDKKVKANNEKTTKETEEQSPIQFDNTLELYVFPFLHGLHTIFSLLCLFLFGLGIRNRLRLK